MVDVTFVLPTLIELPAQLLESGKYRVHGTVRSLGNERLGRRHPLRLLPGAEQRLKLFEAQLLFPGSYDECMDEAQYLIHTASPFVTTNITDAQEQLISPAVKGTRNVLRSAVAARGGALEVIALPDQGGDELPFRSWEQRQVLPVADATSLYGLCVLRPQPRTASCTLYITGAPLAPLNGQAALFATPSLRERP